jgi:hypothetical protein
LEEYKKAPIGQIEIDFLNLRENNPLYKIHPSFLGTKSFPGDWSVGFMQKKGVDL